MPASVFELLFKVRPVAFESGTFGFEAAHPVVVLALALGLAAAAAATYLRCRSRAGSRRVSALAALRLLVVTLLAFALLRPVLRVRAVVPGENFLAVLIDDSRSMRLADGDLTRGARALGMFAAQSSELLDRLSQRFTLRTYRFSDRSRRVDPARSLDFDGRATDLGAALARVRQDLAGVPLAGAVLVTDGADQTAGGTDSGGGSRPQAGLGEELLQLASRGIPVYTVGLGEERFGRDLELSRVAAPERVLEGSSFAVDVTVAQQGYDGETVSLNVELGGAVVASREVTFERGQAGRPSGATVRIHLQAEDAGPRAYRFEVVAGEGEQVAENNAREVLLSVEDRRDKILYFEGEPRFEVRFLRQAVADDDNLQLVVLLRTAENKLLRLGVDDPLELVSGFPATREELFAYRGLVLGSVEASYFTANQLRIIEEFVSQRGGGLLLLGGRRSFAEGGYLGTPLEDLSPLVLSRQREPFYADVRVAATDAGLGHAALQLAVDGQTRRKWRDLPALSMRNPLTLAKPGASVLLTGTPAAGTPAAGTPAAGTPGAGTPEKAGSDPGELVVLASQRYGRGRVAAFPVQDSWIWQMHAQVPLEDMTHEHLWRQLLRWLVSTTPRQVELEAVSNQPAPGETVDLRAEVRDSAYLGVNGAEVSAIVTDPLGTEHIVPLAWTVEEDGEYRATFVPELPGPYEVSVTAEASGERIGGDATRWVAADRPNEFFGAEMNAPLLRRVAKQTGGRFYTAGDALSLAEDARYTKSGKTVLETVELWDMPIVLLLLLASLSGEWLLRRRWGLV